MHGLLASMLALARRNAWAEVCLCVLIGLRLGIGMHMQVRCCSAHLISATRCARPWKA